MWIAFFFSLLLANDILEPEAARANDYRPMLISEFIEPRSFGERGSRRWQVHGGYALEPGDARNQLALAGLGVSYFIIDNLSLEAELNALFFRQRRDDAFAGNVNLLFRWHFLSHDTWSMYIDAGTGMMLASQRVPHDGSRFNFTPQAGAGFSVNLGNDTRLLTGIRWHHISNANLYANNPGRDSAFAYVGVSFGF